MKNIYVGNLEFGITEQAVRSLFEPYGTVEHVSPMTHPATGRWRVFTFVQMTNPSEADRAITALNGTSMGARTLNVQEARPEAERLAVVREPGI